jgi:hypothetical protein
LDYEIKILRSVGSQDDLKVQVKERLRWVQCKDC